MNLAFSTARTTRRALRAICTPRILLLVIPAAFLLSGQKATQDAREQGFVAAGDALRTALARFYRQAVEQGHPGRLFNVVELGREALPLDPYTGRADWVPVRAADGSVIGFHSRATARLRHPEWLSGIAEVCRGRAEGGSDPGRLASWCFDWLPPQAGASTADEPPVSATDRVARAAPDLDPDRTRQSAPLPPAPSVPLGVLLPKRQRQALERHSGELLLLKLAQTLAPPVPRSAAWNGRPGHLPVGFANSALACPQVIAPDTPKPALAPQRLVAVPPAPAPAPQRTGLVPARLAPTDGSQSIMTAANLAPALLEPAATAAIGEGAAVESPESKGDGFADDEPTIACQLKLGVNADAACKSAKLYPDNGVRFEACSQKYDQHMAQCLADTSSP